MRDPRCTKTWMITHTTDDGYGCLKLKHDILKGAKFSYSKPLGWSRLGVFTFFLALRVKDEASSASQPTPTISALLGGDPALEPALYSDDNPSPSSHSSDVRCCRN